jgi:hypothetical protein
VSAHGQISTFGHVILQPSNDASCPSDWSVPGLDLRLAGKLAEILGEHFEGARILEFHRPLDFHRGRLQRFDAELAVQFGMAEEDVVPVADAGQRRDRRSADVGRLRTGFDAVRVSDVVLRPVTPLISVRIAASTAEPSFSFAFKLPRIRSLSALPSALPRIFEIAGFSSVRR